MTDPWLTIVIPTVGRPGLESTLRSIRLQGVSGIEVLVVEDTLSGIHPVVQLLAQKYGATYLAHAGDDHCWGHPQRNAGQAAATGRWLAWMADDDIYLPGALNMIRRTVEAVDPQPVLFRIQMNQYGCLIWSNERYLQVGNIDAECIVTPNDPDRLGRWEMAYTGDFDFIKQTVELHGRCYWDEAIIALTRPKPDEDWTR